MCVCEKGKEREREREGIGSLYLVQCVYVGVGMLCPAYGCRWQGCHNNGCTPTQGRPGRAALEWYGVRFKLSFGIGPNTQCHALSLSLFLFLPLFVFDFAVRWASCLGLLKGRTECSRYVPDLGGAVCRVILAGVASVEIASVIN